MRLTLELGSDFPPWETTNSADKTLMLVVLQILDEVKKDKPTIRRNRLVTPPSPSLKIATTHAELSTDLPTTRHCR